MRVETELALLSTRYARGGKTKEKRDNLEKLSIKIHYDFRKKKYSYISKDEF